MITVSRRLIHRNLEEPAVLETFRLLENDGEVQSYLRMANVMAVKRLMYNDHGPVHARIVAGSALEIFRLMSEAVEPSCVANGVGDYENAKIIVLCGAYLHDIGNAIHRDRHEQNGLVLAAPILERVLGRVYPYDAELVYRLKSEALHTIYASDDKVPCLSVEAGVVTVADGTDLAEGRSREPYKGGKNDIHSVSALAIKRVNIGKGEQKPVKILVEMANPAGIFQIQEVLGKKLESSGLKDLVEVSAVMGGEEVKVP
ncbi:HD domain-containing protein [Candidatus Bathyarchaeota archaeon]|nr:HD domain-containing protein [Candidatus Bathyarchaeota archaeon]